MKFKFHYKGIQSVASLEIIHKTCVDALLKGNKVDIVVYSK